MYVCMYSCACSMYAGNVCRYVVCMCVCIYVCIYVGIYVYHPKHNPVRSITLILIFLFEIDLKLFPCEARNGTRLNDAGQPD